MTSLWGYDANKKSCQQFLDFGDRFCHSWKPQMTLTFEFYHQQPKFLWHHVVKLKFNFFNFRKGIVPQEEISGMSDAVKGNEIHTAKNW